MHSTIDELDNALRPVIDEMFNYAQFAISKDFINDSTKTNDKTNKYIYRENGKTIINIDVKLIVIIVIKILLLVMV